MQQYGRTQTSETGSNGGGGAAVVGLQWGDEGKGKIVDLLTGEFDAVVRYNGGANAGHSVVVKGERYALNLVPSGILYPGKHSVIANGVVVDPEKLLQELEGLRSRGVDVSGLVLSDRAHVVMPYHKVEDELREKILSGSAGGAIGTTKRGIGPCYADKAHRATAVRIMDLLRPDMLKAKLERICAIKNPMLRGLSAACGSDVQEFSAAELTTWCVTTGEKLCPRIRDTTYLLNELVRQGKRLLFEGANAAMLDVDHGTHPYVTSSSTTALGIPSGTGVPGTNIAEIIGVVKAYSTRVGTGPLPTELHDALGEGIRQRGREFGTTTGRPRRVGWLDLVAVKYSAMLNGVTSMAVMLLDVLAGVDELKVCTAYRLDGKVLERFIPDGYTLERVEPVYETLPGFGEQITEVRGRGELPDAARVYIDLIERHVGVPVSHISVGPDRAQTITR